MKKSVVIIILLVAGVSTALAHSLYHSLNKSNVTSSSQYSSADGCQNYQASVLIGGVVKIDSGIACQLTNGSWRLYPSNSRSMTVAGYHGFAGNSAGECLRGKNHSQGLQSRQLLQRLNEIHGWDQRLKKAQPERFQHPPISPKRNYHKKAKTLQPLLVDLSDNRYQDWK